MLLDRDFEVTRAYADAVREAAREENVALVDVWTRFWEAAGKQERGLERVLWDGLHPNPEGYSVS